MTLEIGGKTYQGKKISVLAVETAFLLAEKMDEAQKSLLDPAKRDEYKKCWLQYCDLFMEGDLQALDLDLIGPEDKREIVGFFVRLAGSTQKKPAE